MIYPRILGGFGIRVSVSNINLIIFQVRYLALIFLLSVINELVGVPQGSILGLTLFLRYVNDLPEDVIVDIAIYADDTALYSKCDQASDLRQKLELVSELESDLSDTGDWGRKWLVDFSAGKTQIIWFYWSNNIGAIDVKMVWSVLEEKSPF